MFSVVLRAIYYFLPAYAANAVPVLLARFNLFEGLNIPVDFGIKLRGNYIFGKTKTYRGIIGGAIGGILVAIMQFGGAEAGFNHLNIIDYDPWTAIFLGFLMGLGEGLGDLIKSFFKRRLGIASSASFMPFDQLSFLGALILSFLIYIPPVEIIISILIISPMMPIVANLIAYKLGWKKVWW